MSEVDDRVQEILDMGAKLGVKMDPEQARTVVLDRMAEAQERGISYDRMILLHMQRELFKDKP